MNYEILEKAFSLRRGADGVSEAAFVGWLVSYLASHGHYPIRIDTAGNVIYKVGTGSRVLFAAHTDTVHTDGVNAYVMEDAAGKPVDDMARAAVVRASGAPLGADDAVGIHCLVSLILAGVEASYVFTRSEEVGGIGASHLACSSKVFLKEHDMAICIDRSDTHEVIVMQGGVTCASTEFGEAVANALNDQGMLYDVSYKGVYTDCKEWIGLVPECINIAAGYYSEHTDKECVHLDHVRNLTEALIAIDWASMPIRRKAEKAVYKPVKWNGWEDYSPSPSPSPSRGLYDGLAEYSLGSVDDKLGTWNPSAYADSIVDSVRLDVAIEEAMDGDNEALEAHLLAECGPDFEVALLTIDDLQHAATLAYQGMVNSTILDRLYRRCSIGVDHETE